MSPHRKQDTTHTAAHGPSPTADRQHLFETGKFRPPTRKLSSMLLYESHATQSSDSESFHNNAQWCEDENREPPEFLDRKLQSQTSHRHFPRRGSNSPRMLRFHVRKFLLTQRGVVDKATMMQVPSLEVTPKKRTPSNPRNEKEEEADPGKPIL